MNATAIHGHPIQLSGEMPAPGEAAPAFTLVGNTLADVTSEQFAGQRLVLNVFPSIDTSTCAQSVRQFNELAAGLADTTVLCVSRDLPFAQARFCGAEGIDRVVTGSDFRGGFGRDYGLEMVDGPMKGLLARAVVVLGADGSVLHAQLVPELADEPDYDAALAALG